ncbi:hypothetical protein [Brevundimonas sp.]|uniref:hypothetical protein n=1 Tax=Brevundimonas sp. TaxID=1871086 RepID=UPI003A9034A5
MTGLAMLQRPGRERWRKPALVATSVALHGLVLGYLALTAVGVGGLDPVAIPRHFIPLQLEPRPLLPNERVRVPTPPRTAPPERTAAATAVTPAARRPEEDEARPAPPVPRLALPAPNAPPVDDLWRVRPGTAGTGPALRAGNCRLPPGRLTPAEQTACDTRFGAAALGAAPIRGTGNPQRDARFAAEGARALAAYERLRRPLSGGIGVVGPTDGVGSNFGMGVAGAHLDPSLRPDSTENIRTNRRDGPRD